ncbi:MAG: hypothetical protein KC416_04515 [Myxococcales bacterium]|nr:hypothetical protein [Myxococcales bacterium]
MIPLLLLAGLPWLSMVGCASDSGDAKASPVISDLALDRAELRTGMINPVGVAFSFSTEGGDLLEARIVIRADSGKEVTVSVPVQGTDGTRAGFVSLELSFRPPEDGEYVFEITARDENGNDSNVLIETIRSVQ